MKRDGASVVLECGGNFTPVPSGIRGTRGSRGVGEGYLPAAALDLAVHRSQTRPCGEGKAPSPRCEWKPARFPANAAGIPHR